MTTERQCLLSPFRPNGSEVSGSNNTVLPRIRLCTPDPSPGKQSFSSHHLPRASSPVDLGVKRQSGIPTISISTLKDGTESYTPAAKESSSASHRASSTPNRDGKESTAGSKLASMLKKKTYQALSLGRAQEKDTNTGQDRFLKPPTRYDSVSSWNSASKRRAASMPEPVSQPQSGMDVWPHADPLATRSTFSNGSPPIFDFTRFEDRYRSSSRGDYDGLLAFLPGQNRSNQGQNHLRYSDTWNGQPNWDDVGRGHRGRTGLGLGNVTASAPKKKENSLERDTHVGMGVEIHQSGASQIHPSSERKPHPLLVIDSLAVIVGGTVDIRRFFNVDELLMIHEMDQKDFEAVTRERESVGRKGKENQKAVLGETIRKSSLYASTTMTLGGRGFQLPIVVVHCVEELYRTGIYQPNLFRALPNRPRLLELVSIFDSEEQPPGSVIRSRHSSSPSLSSAKGFGAATSLHLESTPDICALLTSYLSALPEPILPSHLFEPIWMMCGIEGVLEPDLPEPHLPPASSSASFVPMRLSTVPLARSYTPSSEATSILVAQLLLHLLPSSHFALLVYLLSFFSQVALVREENGVGVEDLSRMFGWRIFGHGGGDLPIKPDPRSTKEKDGKGEAMMVWFLRRWGPLSETLFDVVENARLGDPHQTKPNILGRSAMAPAAPAACSTLGAYNAVESKVGDHVDLEEERGQEVEVENEDDMGGVIHSSGPPTVIGSPPTLHVPVNNSNLSVLAVDTEEPTLQDEFLTFTTGPLASSSPKILAGSAGISPSSAILPEASHLNLESTPTPGVTGRADAKHLSHPSVNTLSIDYEEDSPWAKLQQLEAALLRSNGELPDSGLVPHATGGKWDDSTGSDVESETEIHERLLDISMPETILNLEETMPLCEDDDEGTSKSSSPLSSSALSLTAPVTPSPGYARYCAFAVLNKVEQKSAPSLTPNHPPRPWASERRSSTLSLTCEVPPRPPKGPERAIRPPFDGSRPRLPKYRSHNNNNQHVSSSFTVLDNSDPKEKDAIIDALRVQLIETERERDEAKRVVTEVRRVLGDTFP